MKTSISIGSAYYNGANWERMVDYVLEAERIGVNQAWSAEAWGMDSVVPLAFLAAKTHKIGLGTRIMQISARVPSMIAMTAQSLARVSNGRFTLGLGVSGPQVVEGLHGAAFAHPLARLRECVEIVRLGLRGEPLSYTGKHYLLPRPGGEGKPIRLSQPPSPGLPIHLATLGPKALEMTGELADGWLGAMFMPEHAQVFLAPIERGAVKAGRTLSDIEIQVDVELEVGDHLEEMVSLRKPQMAFILGGMGSAKTNFYNEAVRRAGYEDAAAEVQRLWVAGKKDEAARRVPDELILKTSLIGTETMIRERLELYRGVGVTALNLQPSGNSESERLDTLARGLELIAG